MVALVALVIVVIHVMAVLAAAVEAMDRAGAVAAAAVIPVVVHLHLPSTAGAVAVPTAHPVRMRLVQQAYGRAMVKWSLPIALVSALSLFLL